MRLSVTLRQIDGRRRRRHSLTLVAGAFYLSLLAAGAGSSGQTPSGVESQGISESGVPVTITLDEAIRRAEANEPIYAAARAVSQSAALDRSIARASLLPNARFYSQGIYIQPNGITSDNGEGVPSAPNPRFVSADARPREYIAQGIVDETLSLAGPASVRRADATAAMARAELEIARRGLVATVTGLFYGSIAAEAKLKVAEQALKEATDFTALTTQREKSREAAHADVVKAQLTEQQRDARTGGRAASGRKSASRYGSTAVCRPAHVI